MKELVNDQGRSQDDDQWRCSRFERRCDLFDKKGCFRFGCDVPAVTKTRADTRDCTMVSSTWYPKLLLIKLLLLCSFLTTQASTVATSRLQRPRTLTVGQRLLAGGTSRAMAQMTLYPIDALRTLAQTRDGRTLADVGVGALVRGCTTTSSFALIMGSIQFAVFGFCCSKQVPTLVSSALGATASCLVSVPQEVIKQRLVTGIYPSFRSAVAQIWEAEGVKGFYSAWKPTMARNVPFVMATFTAMELLQQQLVRHRAQKNLSLSENMAIGMSSALVAGLLTQPADVIKTRMMTQAASNALPYRSALDCLSTIVREEGVLQLYAGLGQRSTYMCLLWGMTFALNGHFHQMLTRTRPSTS